MRRADHKRDPKLRDLDELKRRISSSAPVPSPTPGALESLQRHIDVRVENYKDALEASGKWAAVMADLKRSPLDELFYASEGNRGHALSLMERSYLDEVQRHAEIVLERGVPGDFCEAGVFRGGISLLLAAVLAKHDPSRHMWCADSFQGLPPPQIATDGPEEIVSYIVLEWAGAFSTSAEEVRSTFRRFDLWSNHVHLLEGWFEDTLPTAPIDALSLLRIDCQYERSTQLVLDTLYPKLSPGGRILLNDYGHDKYWGARTAIDDFRDRNNIRAELGMHGHTAWWSK